MATFCKRCGTSPDVQGAAQRSGVGALAAGAVQSLGEAWAGATGYNPVSNQYYSPLEQQQAMWGTVASIVPLGAGVKILGAEKAVFGNIGSAAETAAAAARMDFSAQFTVSKTPQGVRLQYGDPNGWSAVGGDSHGIIGFVDKDGILGVDVYASAELRTQYGSGRDMYNNMMTRLQQENVDITGIRGAWLKGTDSVNYAQYQSSLAAGLEPAQSALNTWTGKLAQSYGYGQVESITGSNSNVYVLFRKPGSGR